MRPGCYDPVARLADMDEGRIEAMMCFPSSFPRFCGQTFSETPDKELGLACIEAYNDWMVEEWCGGSGGRLIPLIIVPCGTRSSPPPRSAATRPAACAPSPSPRSRPTSACRRSTPATGTRSSRRARRNGVSVHMHIGSSSKMPSTSTDAPPLVASALTFGNAMASMVDFLLSGVLVRFPNGWRSAYSEGQIGWIPYILERTDHVWEQNRAWGNVGANVPEPPSTYYHRQVYGCFFEDQHGLTPMRSRRSTPSGSCSRRTTRTPTAPGRTAPTTAQRLMGHLDQETVNKLCRGNAIRLLGLDLSA
jgi:hypothetical protein